MVTNFNDNIKSLRKQRGLTQEQLSEVLGVSCQAVSKWETGCTYPDISLLPVIAGYFGVSVDYLLGYDRSESDAEVDRVCREADDLSGKGAYMLAVPLLREALFRHPGNERLMYALAWTLSGTLRESPDNYEEAILIYQKILEISTDTEMRIKVQRDLMYRYYTHGETEKGLFCAHRLPPFEMCREYNLGRSNLLEGNELAEYLRENIQRFGRAMLECLEYFESEGILSAEQMAPYTTELAKAKIAMIREVLA